MKSRDWLFGCAFALCLVPSLASADEAPVVTQVRHQVEAGLVKPLAAFEAERSRFSRARMPPAERRVRILQATVSSDGAGRSYLPFAVDVRFGTDWQANDIVGCAYTQNGNLFVKRGEVYRPAAFLLGKKADPVPGVCTGPAAART